MLEQKDASPLPLAGEGPGEREGGLPPSEGMAAPQPSPAQNAALGGWGYARWLILSALVVILDQLSKYVISSHFAYGEAYTVTPFFDLVLAHNQGAAFGFLNEAGGWQRWLFTAIAVAASVWVVRWLRAHREQKLFCISLALILGGALGNLADRIAYGYVVDFLDFHWNQHHFAAFNLADSAITCGAALWLLDSYMKDRRARATHPPLPGE